jgi:hypothetical protein
MHVLGSALVAGATVNGPDHESPPSRENTRRIPGVDAGSRRTRSRVTGKGRGLVPDDVTGKVQKFRMRELAIEELELQLAAGIATA